MRLTATENGHGHGAVRPADEPGAEIVANATGAAGWPIIRCASVVPSFLHEALVMLFRHRATLAAEVIASALDVELPQYTDARIEEADLGQIAPAAYHADLVVLLTDGEPVYGIVVEVQLRADENKRYSWPLYAAALRARLRCPTSVLVVAPDSSTARWAAAPLAMGHPGSSFAALVLRPGAVPRVIDPDTAAAAPELAVLSALAHANARGGIEVVVAALSAAAGLDERRAALYADLVMASLSDAVTQELNAMVQSGEYQYQSKFAKEHIAKGRAEGIAAGKAEVVLRILAGRGLSVSDVQRSRVLECTDNATLDRWVDRALQATSIDDVFDDQT